MRFWVYIILCGDGSYYVGSCNDLERRMKEHDDATAYSYTAERKPLELVFAENVPSYEDAALREKQLKGWSRAKKKALIEGNWDRVRALAKGRHAQDRG
jgi:predicted GIY-YIG superfamily endonuclease